MAVKLNKIALNRYVPIVEEHDANAAISPGMLAEFLADDKVQPHSNATGPATPALALCDALQGNGPDVAYESGDKVQVGIFRTGDRIAALLAVGESITDGDYLGSNGAGYWTKVTDPRYALAQAREDKDTTATDDTATLIRARVM